MGKNTQYFYATIVIRNGEREEYIPQLVVANSSKRANLVLDRATASYYGDDTEEDEDGGYYADGGQVYLCPDKLVEISFTTFLEMKAHIAVNRDTTAPASDDVAQEMGDLFKSFSKSVSEMLGNQGVSVSHSRLLNVMAMAIGKNNWHVLQKAFKAISPNVAK